MTEHFVIATTDVALLAQNCVVAAESMGLGSCYIGSVRNHPDAVAELLGLPQQVYPVFGLCLGWPDQDPERKPRLPLPAVLMEERYREEGIQEVVRAYDETLRDYYLRRTGGTKDSCWSLEMKTVVGKEARPHMRGFLASRGMATR
jgi:nitroreductase